MQPRANYQKAMLALHAASQKTSLAPELLDLVYYRVSQINGCAFCLDMHSKDLRARGETEQRLYMVSAWHEAKHLYNIREQAALSWAEAVTRLVDQEVSDQIYDQARDEFSETELAHLTLAVVAINGWNRLNIAFRTPAGSYNSPIRRSAA
jgi:AhpD family alkylhydroperoxidase